MLLALLVLACPPAWAGEGPAPKKILILYSYHKGVPWEDLVNQGVRSVLASAQPGSLQISEEYADLVRFPQEAHASALVDMLRLKYAQPSPDLVLASGEEASRFLMTKGAGLFPGVPTVLLVGKKDAYKSQSLPAHMTSVMADEDVNGTLALALGLLPDTRRVFVVAGSSFNDRQLQERARAQLTPRQDRLEITYLSGLTAQELLDRVSNLPPNSIVLFLNFLRDAAGQPFIPRDFQRVLSARANAPLFSLYDTYLGWGSVGGNMTSAEALGQAVARTGLRILAGQAPADIPPAQLANTPILDWRQLKRWGLEGRPLPGDAAVRFREYSFLELNWGWVLGAVVLVLLQAALITILLTQKRRARAEEAARRQAQEALSLSEKKFRLAFHTSPDAIAITRLSDGRYVDINQGFLATTGYGREEIIGHTTQEISIYHDPGDRQRLVAAIQKHGHVNNMEIKFRLKDGAVVTGLMSAVAFELEGQACALGITRIIEEIKQAQQALQESEEKFRLAFQTSPDAIGITRLSDAQYVEVNEGFCAISGYTREELLGKTSAEINIWVDPTDRRRLVEALERRGLVRSLEAKFRLKDGTVVAALMSAAIFELGGQRYILYMAKIIEDLKQAQRALQESEDKFAKAFMASPVWVSITTLAEGRFLEVNEAFSRITGFSRQEVLGRTAVEINLWPGGERGRENMREALLRQGYLRDHEALMHFKDGQDHQVLVSAELVPVGGERCLVSVIVDVTEQRRLEREKDHLEGQLAQAQKMEAVGTLAGGIAHDFNNILAAVLGFAEIAQELAQEGRDNSAELSQIVDAAQRASRLVRQILTFSRKVKADRRPLALNDTLAEVTTILRRTLPKMVSIQTRLTPDLATIDADPTQMEQVLFNLAANANDAMPGGGRLLLETDNLTVGEAERRQWPEVESGPYVLLTVSDNGQGMDLEIQGQIFDPFFTTKGPGKGTGLGLSTVYGIVKGHGGYIFCQSVPKGGTSFQILLPARDQPAGPQEAASPAPPAQGGQETVLLVDDEPPLLEVGRRILGGAGYQVLTAQSGEEALASLQGPDRRADLVILDLSMPGMGGHRCLARILAQDPQARVLVASGYSAEGMAAQSLAAGALGFVAKPFGKVELLAAVRRALDQTRN
jgi:PAS domain S-box-containing protein